MPENEGKKIVEEENREIGCFWPPIRISVFEHERITLDPWIIMSSLAL
jgi:hypothetical protein